MNNNTTFKAPSSGTDTHHQPNRVHVSNGMTTVTLSSIGPELVELRQLHTGSADSDGKVQPRKVQKEELSADIHA